ncbi:amidohydrolase family protein [Planctomycetota bacterium]
MNESKTVIMRIIVSKIVLTILISCVNITKADLAVTNVTIIDTTGGPSKSNMTVLVTENRIAKISTSQESIFGDDVKIVDGSGKFLIPGLWDMHVHLVSKTYLPLFIANGVTGCREMAGSSKNLQWRKEWTEGRLLCPRLEIGSPHVDGPKPTFPDAAVAVRNPEEARATVRQLKNEGYDFIKIFHLLSREAYLAVTDECKKNDIPFAGHLPFSLSAAEAVEAGLKSNEHLICVLLSCSTHEDKYREELMGLIAAETPGWPIFEAWICQTEMYVQTFDKKKFELLNKHFAQHNCWQCPTLSVTHSYANLDNADFKNDPRSKYMPENTINSWTGNNDLTASLMKRHQKLLKLITPMHKAGVRFLAGTDLGGPYLYPGFSLHDELDMLVQAGLTPMEALQASTHNAAEYLGRIDSLGTIEQGKLADLVLLDADPLADIRNTQKICAVIFDGKLFEKVDIEKILQNTKDLANNTKKK